MLSRQQSGVWLRLSFSLQEASEVFLVSLFEDANLCARHAGYAVYKK